MTFVKAWQGRFYSSGGGLRGYCNGLLQWGRETGLIFKYGLGKWEFIAKKQGVGGGRGKVSDRKHWRWDSG